MSHRNSPMAQAEGPMKPLSLVVGGAELPLLRKQTADFVQGPAFAENPIGVNFDPDYLLERLRDGADLRELVKQGAGTRAGTTVRANKRAVTWKTL